MNNKVIRILLIVLVFCVSSARAATQYLVTVPADETGSITIRLRAPIFFDSYNLTLSSTTNYGISDMRLLRNSVLSTDLSWKTPSLGSFGGTSSSASRDGDDWVWTVSGLPPGDYSVDFDGTGVVYTAYETYSTEALVNLFRLFDDYGMLYIVVPSSGWFTQIIWDAAPHMLITVDSFSY